MSKPLYVLISGKQGSGKTTTADALYVALRSAEIVTRRSRFASTIYEMHDAIRNIAIDLGIPMPKKDGKLLQLLGTEWGRNNYGDNVWVDALVSGIRRSFIWPDVVLIDDCRFPNELTCVPVDQRITVRLECDKAARRARADGWRDTDTHASETALDGHLDKFDYTFDTLTCPTDFIVGILAEQIIKLVAGNSRGDEYGSVTRLPDGSEVTWSGSISDRSRNNR